MFEQESTKQTRKKKSAFILVLGIVVLSLVVLSFAKNSFFSPNSLNPKPEALPEIASENNTDAITTSIDDTGIEEVEVEQDIIVQEVLELEKKDINLDTSNIVEELSFATAEDANDKNNSDAEAKLYCLNPTIGSGSSELLNESCERISKRLASVSMKICETAELAPSGCESVSGFPLLVSEFPPLIDREARGRILVIGGMHGDELTSVSIVFRWIASLKKFHSGLFHWHMVPMMNPDGVLNKWATRTNKNGVDLNRNLPSDDWEVRALKYWKEKVGSKPRRYPGKSAASEPETQWLIDEINTFKPDAIINVHAPYGVVDFDSLILNSAPKTLGKLHLNLLGTYPGSLGNYAGINRNIPVITLELPHAWEMPTKDESTKIWEDIVAWLRENVNTEQAANP